MLCKSRSRSRLKRLLPIYTQIATRFASYMILLGMAAKGVIGEVVIWKDSRSFFYKRLNRRRKSHWSRLLEMQLVMNCLIDREGLDQEMVPCVKIHEVEDDRG
ncbi:hypothetical protein IFM89_030329 [Coptis chinensis]|uniref:Uncharacterized protein n=1 Tax=Coptis chinensis TaxID=261450 RepID=A0A835IHH0_9MAGN|nr:hypothetical protein IFM89_030329 [Coptis chinensis]